MSHDYMITAERGWPEGEKADRYQTHDHKHVIYHGPATRAEPASGERNSVDLLFFDTPGITDSTGVIEYETWFAAQLEIITKNWVRADAALILVPRDRKGHHFQKSVLTAAVAMEQGWEVFRQFIVMQGEADFHRARYCYQPVWAMRRGSMASNAHSPLRYKDVVRIKDSALNVSTIWGFSTSLVDMFFSLFAGSISKVMDPFAGTGSILEGAIRNDLSSVSCETDDHQVQMLREIVREYRG